MRPTNMGIYPHRRLSESRGKELEFKQMATVNANRAARSEYARAKYTATASLSDMPFVGLAVALFGKIVAVNVKDSRRGFDFSANPIKFKVVGVSVGLKGMDRDVNGGGYYTASLNLLQVEDLPA